MCVRSAQTALFTTRPYNWLLWKASMSNYILELRKHPDWINPSAVVTGNVYLACMYVQCHVVSFGTMCVVLERFAVRSKSVPVGII